MKKIAIIVAILLLALDGYHLSQNIKDFRQAEADLQKESSYVEDIQIITDKNREYYQTIMSVSDSFYSEERLFSLWKNMEKNFGSAFEVLSLNPKYIEDSGLKWFDLSVTVHMDPISFINIVKKIHPPLFIENLRYDKHNNTIVASLRGAIITDHATFVITPELMKSGSYVVCKYIMNTDNKDLIPANSSYFVVEKDQVYYVGQILDSSLDAVSAESIANDYASKGIITFIAQQGG